MPTGVYKRTKPGWNKGLTKETDARVAAQGKNSWNKGKTAKTDLRVAANAKAVGKAHKDDPTIAANHMLSRNRFNGTREEAIILTNLKNQYPLHIYHFDKMHSRCGWGYATIDPDFSWTTEGFLNFINYVGPYPHYMTKPSIGRDNHDEGYIIDNFRWQELSENSSEAAKRNAELQGGKIGRNKK